VLSLLINSRPMTDDEFLLLVKTMTIFFSTVPMVLLSLFCLNYEINMLR